MNPGGHTESRAVSGKEGPSGLTLVHTSDWHIGRTLYGRKRYAETEAFLEWLLGVLDDWKADILVVAGDVFDTGTPGNRAQELYYRFLHQAAGGGFRRHVVVTAGNHDSPTFLDAPRELLKPMNVHVAGTAGEPEDEVLVLRDGAGRPMAVVCAVPFLRERDVRVSRPGESPEEKTRNLVQGIRDHYGRVCRAAEQRRETLGEIPLIATGHLFTAGGRTVDADGVRELYVGSLARVGVDLFPKGIDYLALGHLHVPQQVGGDGRMRYSGSPIPMGFGEAGQEKQVVRVTFRGRVAEPEWVAVPCFRELTVIRGDLDAILDGVARLRAASSRAWLDVRYTGSTAGGDVRALVEEAVTGSEMEVLRISNRFLMEDLMHPLTDTRTLDDLSAGDVFSRCLDAASVPEGERPGLVLAHDEILASVLEGSGGQGED